MKGSSRYRFIVFDYGGTLTHCAHGTDAPRDPLFTGKTIAAFLSAKGRGDFDVHRLEDLAAVVNAALPPAGQIADADITARLVRWARDIYRRLGWDHPLRCECEELAANYRWCSLHRSEEVPPENKEVLHLLRARGYRLGVISNNDGYVEDRLIVADIRACFEVVVDSARAGVCKPDPAIFHLAADHLNARPEECLYVGDDYECDLRGAQAAGWHIAWLERRMDTGTYAQQPEYSLRALPDLLQYLA